MRTVLVPIDFSDTSFNAAAYAAQMLTGMYGVNMLLYHVYGKPEHAASSEQELNKLKVSLFDIGIVKMQILCGTKEMILGLVLKNLSAKTSPI